ncbi:MAG: hypothetical protein KIH89_003775 [Candidatus Shapirobacteria bacterium]|nr:hypothetical protein [Candidatus Shapirobacteria bacterium]
MGWFKKYWFLLILFFLAIILVVLKITYKSTDTEKKQTKKDPDQEILVETNQITNIEEKETENESSSTSSTLNKDKSNENVFVTDEGEKINASDYKSEDLSDSVSVDDLSPFLPYKGKYFRADRYLNKGYLEVIVSNENDLPKAREEVEAWLKENNTDSQETQLIYVFK